MFLLQLLLKILNSGWDRAKYRCERERLEITDEALSLAEDLVNQGAMPQNAAEDA